MKKNSNKKIHIAAPFVDHGGAEKQFRFLIDALMDLGVSPKIHILGEEREFKIQNSALLNRKNVIFYNSSVLKFSKKPIHYAFTLLRFIINCKESEIVYFYSAYFLPVIPFLKFFNKKVIFSERIFSENTKKRLLFYKIAKMSDRFVVNSDELYDYFSGNGFRNLFILKNRVNKIYSEPDNQKDIEVCIISRYDYFKNIGFAISALKHRPDLQLNIFGDGDQKYRKELEQLAKTIGSLASFNGPTPIEVIYTSNALIIHPSIAEGSSNVILEAMASRKPILASNIRANIDTGIHPDCLFDPHHAPSLLNCLENLNFDGKDWQERLDHNQNVAESRFGANAFKTAIAAAFDLDAS